MTTGVPDHLLGDDRDPSWGDMSRFVVHFTREQNIFAEILGTGSLKRGPKRYGFGRFREIRQVQERHRSVCFTEVPLDKLDRLTGRHGSYGIAFSKDFIRDRGGARVWYVEQGSQLAVSLGTTLGAVANQRDFNHPLWDLTPCIDLVIPGKYEWDWEREWRVRDDIVFARDDVAFVITPQGINEVPGVSDLHDHPKHGLNVSASPLPLTEYVENLVQEFLQTFEDPINSLPYDEGDYVWIVQRWDTEDAVDELFGDLEDSLHWLLLDYLNGLSVYWVRSEDVASIGD